MNYISVCSGIEAATVAWHSLGWNPVAFSEIEPFPSRVLAHHYPYVPNLGDMTKYKEWNIGKPIDILVGGTPCQSFSVAGLRKGLEDPRGNLALVYCGILDRLRPQWFVWENVPGVLSSNGGRDFGSFLGALAELGYGFAYRVLDAQYFGVAQRRRRVFVVGYLGDWKRAAEVLFEPESLRRDSPPSRKAGKVAPTIPSRSTAGGGLGTDFDLDGGVIAARMVAFGEYVEDGTASAMKARDYKDATDLVAQPTWGIPGNWIGRKPENGGNAVQPMYDVSPNLTAADRHGVAHPIVGAFFVGQGAKAGGIAYDEHVSPTLKASDSGTNRTPTAHVGMAVRRLTPVECERLQGFPDNYTNIPWRKSPESPDGLRYKALGNSMAVPVMAWIGKRIAEQ